MEPLKPECTKVYYLSIYEGKSLAIEFVTMGQQAKIVHDVEVLVPEPERLREIVHERVPEHVHFLK